MEFVLGEFGTGGAECCRKVFLIWFNSSLDKQHPNYYVYNPLKYCLCKAHLVIGTVNIIKFDFRIKRI